MIAGALGLPVSTKMYAAVGLANHPPLKAAGGSIGSHKGPSEKHAFPGEVIKPCFICGSKTHLKYDCPDRSKSGIKSGMSRSNAKVTTCQLQKQSHCETLRAPLNVEKRNQSIQTVDAEIQVCAESNTTESCNNEFCFVDTNIIESDNIERYSACDYAKLHYLDIKVADDDRSSVKVMRGLQDSGAQISVIHTDAVSGFNLRRIGTINLRGIIGSPVTADLFRLNVALANSHSDDNKYMSVLCVVCFEANDDLILTSSVVDSSLATVTSKDDDDSDDVDVDDSNDTQVDVVRTDNESRGDDNHAVLHSNDANDKNTNNGLVDDVSGATDRSFSETRADVKTMQKE